MAELTHRQLQVPLGIDFDSDYACVPTATAELRVSFDR
jgi:hypothetical protein